MSIEPSIPDNIGELNFWQRKKETYGRLNKKLLSFGPKRNRSRN
jgi:hypothetical protein